MKENEYIADDRRATPEYFSRLCNMSDEEFEEHIDNLRKMEEKSSE